ncbi:hypothetical protein [Streptomyces sp. RerS4]|uniref:hypothetical protein n=1 Tax=Streptomyces sp. RerS4 TaxID=2942449 RepID=UPI00201BD1CA|nr:hypothetical protein [Streptomyces sp. RerS4]UQX04488.1 hypothetical protein M4D82_31250 [Streptomyces sp. RerS4]
MFMFLWAPFALLAVGCAWVAVRGAGALSPAPVSSGSWWVAEPQHAACNECGGTQNCPSGCVSPGVD